MICWSELRLLRATVLLALAVLAGAGCKRDPSRRGAQPVTQVRIGYFANVTHAQAVLGVASGDFARAVAPAKLDTKVFNAGPSLIEALLADQIDIGYVGPGPVVNIQARSQGKAVRVIAAAASNGVVIVARKGAGISKLEDLKGKRLATPQHGNTQDIAARHFLTAVLRQGDDSNIVPINNAEQAGMMSRGQIDASWAPEPWGSRLIAQANAVAIGEEKDLWPGGEFNITVVVTTPTFLADHPDVVEKVLRVHRDWTQKLQRQPEAYVGQLDEALFALTNGHLPAGVLASSLGRVKFTDEPLPDTLRTLADWTYDLKLIQDPVKLDGLVDTRILQRLGAPSPATSPSKETADAADRLDSR
jgi:NitT/TauT family transport system substrate-binding protein